MNKLSQQWRAVLAAGVALGLILALGLPSGTHAQVRARTLIVAIPGEPPSLDPADSAGVQADLMYHYMRKLYSFTPDMVPHPDLVVSEKVSADQRTWTFELRRDVVFHDGTPVNAEAVKYTIDRMNDPRRAAPLSVLFAPIKEVRVKGEYTVEVETKQPFASLRNNLAHPNTGLISPAADRVMGSQFGRKPVSAGPYYVSEWAAGERIVFKRFDRYTGKRPYYEQIVFRVVPDPQTRLIMLERGEVDVAIRMPATHAQHVARISKLQVIRLDGTRLLYMWFNMDKAPTNDVRVRRALNLAIDREAIMKRITLGASAPVSSLIERIISFSTPVGKLEYNVEQARTLLREAGAVGQTVTMITPQGNYPFDRQIAEAVAGYFRTVGMRAEIDVVEDVGAYVRTMTRRQHHMGMVAWAGSTADPDHYLRRQLWGGIAGRPWNFGGYKNARVDELIGQGASTFDNRERAKIYAEIQKIIWNDHPWLVLHRISGFAFARAEIQGIEVYLNSEAHVFIKAKPKEQ